MKKFNLVTVIAAVLTWAGPVGAVEVPGRDCDHQLVMVPVVQIEKDLLAVPVPRFGIPSNQATLVQPFLRTFADAKEKTLLLIENDADLTSNPHETETAREYAAFVRKTHDLHFVLVTEVAGRSTPVFDGLLVDSRGNGLINVSLKYSSLHVVKQDAGDLLKALAKRLELEGERRMVKSPIHWFRAASGMPASDLRSLFTPEYRHQIDWVAPVAAIFNLFRPEAPAFGRELRMVVDMRDSGYDFEFVSQPELLTQIEKLIEVNRDQKISLTLIWDRKHAIEFEDGGFSVY